MRNKNTLPLVALTLSIVGILVSAVSAYLLADLPLVWEISLGIGVGALVAYIALDWKSIFAVVSRRGTKYGMNAGLVSIVAIAIAVFANMIGAEHDLKKDVTKNQIHSLSDQSIKILTNLKTDVTAKVFTDPRYKGDLEENFGRYTYYSKKFHVDFVDYDRDPTLMKKYKIKAGAAATIVIESDSREARVDNLSGVEDPKFEEKITNAIIQATKGGKKKIYFVTGHGEHSPADSSNEGLSSIKDALEAGRYSVSELLLISADKIPTDADVIVDAGPKSEIMERELKLLDEYQQSGGKLLMMVDPQSPASLKPFLAKYGADWNPKKTVYELNPLQKLAPGQSPLVPVITSYDFSHEITRDIRNIGNGIKDISVFPIPTPIEKMAKMPEGYSATSLFSTSARSLEVDMVGDQVKVNEKSDRRGPLSLALAITGPGKKAPSPAADAAKKPNADKEASKSAELRMVAVGDSRFIMNGVSTYGINSDLFQNMVNWLSNDEDLISIRPRPSDMRQFDLTEMNVKIVFLASVFFLPLIMIFSGLAVWLSRRRK